ncbi:glycosyltransferase family 2 protein [Campylobacter volucris]|uniref:glycosyltransferase family 2 protein n=1 Tax=Campylobacter volucris TaxID=1031542 RepID=UPI00105A6C30|nr:glycosyltransferase family 2 protein [Campylobacter volucris]TDJ80262.1 glycosyltransferase family 2 protein [Campylobacter volucris]
MSKISIILPTYNVEKYIARALDSCINQTYKDIEIIVVDDLGDDKSIDIAKEYASKDERIKIIHNDKNLGTFASRNIGVLNSNSPYIMFLDPDDYLDLKACELVLKSIKNNNILQFNMKIKNIDDSNHCIAKNFKDFKKNIKNLEFMPWNLCTLLVKKEFYLERVKFHRRRILFAEDMLVFISLINSKMFFLDIPLYYYDQNKNSITKSTNKEKYKIQLKDQIFILKQIEKSNLDKDIIAYYRFFLKRNILFCLYKLQKISFLKYKLIKKQYKISAFFYKILGKYI